MTDIVRLKLIADTSDLDKADKKVKGLAGTTGKTSKSMKVFSTAVKGAGIALAGLAAAAAAAEALSRLGREAIATADAIGKTSSKLGLTAEELQELRVRADAAGVSTQALEVGFQRFTRRVDEARSGTGELKKAFEQLDISLTDQNGQFKTNRQLFKEFGNAIRDVDDASQAVKLTFAGVDSEGVNLINMFRQSEEEQQRLIQTARDYGVILDNEIIAKSEEWQTQLGLIDQAQAALQTQTQLALAPITLAWENAKLKVVQYWTEVLKAKDMIPRTAAEDLDYGAAEIEIAIEKLQKFTGVGSKAIQMMSREAREAMEEELGRPLAMDEVFVDLGTWRERLREVHGEQEQFSAKQIKSMIEQIALEEERRQLLLDRMKLNEEERQREEERRQREAEAAEERALALKNEREQRAKEAAEKAAADRAEREAEAARAKAERERLKNLEEIEKALERAAQKEYESLQNWLDIAEPTREYKRQLEEIEMLMAKFPQHGTALKEAWEKVNQEMKEMQEGGGEKGQDGPLKALLKDYQDLSTQAEIFKVEGIERVSDALGTLATEGKLNFREFAVDMLKWVAKMIIRMAVLRAVMAAVGAVGGGGTPTPTGGVGAGGASYTGGYGGYADSGKNVNAGMAYTIGTGAQPELFIPKTAGTLIPSSQLGGGGGVTIQSVSVTVQERKDETSEQQAQRIAKAMKEQLKPLIHQELVDQHRPGNMFNGMRGAYA